MRNQLGVGDPDPAIKSRWFGGVEDGPAASHELDFRVGATV
jgi:hypothetical protein